MKVIFLDIDGVLNSEKTCEEWHNKTGEGGYGGWFEEEDTCTDENIKWGRDLFANLRRIVEKTDSVIVISSTWRKYFSISKFKEMFLVYGWENAPIIDKTGYDVRRHRGTEVKSWLKDKDIESYVILDDDTDFLDEQVPYFVNTDGLIGLSESDTEKAIKILNNGTV